MNVAASILSGGEPGAPAVLDRDGVCTYDELRQRVSGVASVLLARDRAKGDRIGIFAENGAFFVTAYLGIIRAGLVAVPLQAEWRFGYDLTRIAALHNRCDVTAGPIRGTL